MIRMAGSLLSTARLRPLFYDLPFHSDARGSGTKVDWNHTDLNLNSQYQRALRSMRQGTGPDKILSMILPSATRTGSYWILD